MMCLMQFSQNGVHRRVDVDPRKSLKSHIWKDNELSKSTQNRRGRSQVCLHVHALENELTEILPIMSPEPTQEPIQDNLTVSNVVLDARTTNDEEDSDDEDMGMAGYMPLSQVSTDADPILGEEENDEWLSGIGESSQASSVPATETQQSCSSEILEVWSCPQNRSDIDLDATKIKEVKSVMASITIPETSIPQWANAISEEQWKEQLLVRIKQMQNKDS